jgi:hypothetical protein
MGIVRVDEKNVSKLKRQPKDRLNIKLKAMKLSKIYLHPLSLHKSSIQTKKKTFSNQQLD